MSNMRLYKVLRRINMSSLLKKTRMLNKILQKSGKDPVAFQDICRLLSDV